MKKFIKNLTIFGIICLTIYFIVSYKVKPQNIVGSDFMAAMLDKHHRAENIHSPKIIFAGGSNLAFGLNSKKIENEFSVPVVNLGLNAALGLDFMLNELKDEMKKGDIVFISPEYFLAPDGNYKFKKNAALHCKLAYNYFDSNLKDEILLDLDETRLNLTIDQDALNAALILDKEMQEVYSRKAFNEYGDVTAHLNKKHHPVLNDKKNMKYKYWLGIDRLNEFYNYAKLKGVSVYFMYPNLASSEYEHNKEVIEKLSVDVSSNLVIEILNQPNDFVFSDELFFDTVYHLSKKGREMRTGKLIEIIHKSTSAMQSVKSIRAIS